MRPHYKFWPKRLPHAITPPATPLWDNLAVNARRYPDKAALVFMGMVLGNVHKKTNKIKIAI